MEKISETGISKYSENIGKEGTKMEIRVETTKGGKNIFGRVVKDGTEAAVLSRDVDRGIILSVTKPTVLSDEEFDELFSKSASVIREILGEE